MQILVDADACPVKEIIVRLAKCKEIPVTMLIDTAHELNDGYSCVVTVDKGADSVDFALIGLLKSKDIVVTGDYGLAAMALGKGAQVIHPNGWVYCNENMDRLLMERHLNAKARRASNRIKGPAKRTKEDDDKFATTLSQMIG
ncbi:MAG: YaiI/YqxD family protein [Defluviitaleaceae bacterium]|nr:YaiI/YqxD family protein [Defluviitaleaceae bacterium]